MRSILMALALGISVAAFAAPALAGEMVDAGIEKFLAQSDRDTPQINVGVVAGTDEPSRPAWLEQRYDNMDDR